MRASILFGVAIALLFGLAVVVAARYTGFFTSDPIPVAKKTVPPRVLVAKTNLFKEVTVTSRMVMVRDLYPEEKDDYEKNRSSYLPALASAAHLRITMENIPANVPLKQEYFRKLGLPDPISERLKRLGRDWTAVQLTLDRDQAAGGLLQVDERADVFLTTEIRSGNGWQTVTAQIARSLPIIAKRNNLWIVMQPVKKKEPIRYTLGANLYRAALIGYARTKGQISLMPTSTPSFKYVKGASFSDAGSVEYTTEDERVQQVRRGEYIVGEKDLMRIFNIKELPPPPPPLRVERISGVNLQGAQVFGKDGSYYYEGADGRIGSYYNITSPFRMPGTRRPNTFQAQGGGSRFQTPPGAKTPRGSGSRR